MKVIARIHTDFPEKFGIPRQSGLVRELEGKIVFEPEYRNPQALKGLEEFSHNVIDLHNVIHVINICNNFYCFFIKCCRIYIFVQHD